MRQKRSVYSFRAFFKIFLFFTKVIFFCFQKRTIDEEIHLWPAPQPFLNSLFPDVNQLGAESPPQLQQLENMFIDKPAIYHLEPPGIWNDANPPIPKWKIYDITFL